MQISTCFFYFQINGFSKSVQQTESNKKMLSTRKLFFFPSCNFHNSSEKKEANKIHRKLKFEQILMKNDYDRKEIDFQMTQKNLHIEIRRRNASKQKKKDYRDTRFRLHFNRIYKLGQKLIIQFYFFGMS